MSLEMRRNAIDSDSESLEGIIEKVDQLSQRTKDIRKAFEREENKPEKVAEYEGELDDIVAKTNGLLNRFSKLPNTPDKNEMYDQHFDPLYLQIGLTHVRLSE